MTHRPASDEAPADPSAADDAPPYSARVLRRIDVSPHVVRITLHDVRVRSGGIAPVSTGRADEFFGLWVPGPGGEPAKRYYTVRAWRAGELDVDLLRHGPGAASQWADIAAPGDVVSFDAPRGHYAPPADARWIGLAGDGTALPAIGRILAERPVQDGGPSMRIVVALDDPADRPQLPVLAGDTVSWVEPDTLVAATLALAESPEPGYLWFAGEAAQMRAVRHRLRRELRWPESRWTTMAYWRRDSERWLARLWADGGELVGRLEAIYAEGGDDEDLADRAEELLSERGLL